MKAMDKSVLSKLIAANGYDVQEDKLLEEMAELAQAIFKMRIASKKLVRNICDRCKKDYKNAVEDVVGEMSDVYICLEELKMMLLIDDEEMGERINYKLGVIKKEVLGE